VQGHSGYQEAMSAVTEYAAGHLERVETRTGRAFDLPLLLSRTS